MLPSWVIFFGNPVSKIRQRSCSTKAPNLTIKRIEEGADYPDPYYDLAAINAIQGHKEEAYNWLQQAIALGWREYPFTLNDPLFENMRHDERFRQMMAQIKAEVDAMRRRVKEKGG